MDQSRRKRDVSLGILIGPLVYINIEKSGSTSSDIHGVAADRRLVYYYVGS